ncbi:Arc family DNA-binding protein [Arsenophonus sp. aPb]|uniref:Arc family DNA-binding protein n=1 Tax=Arsenophonus sp. aPb TaxID=3041619 RepID=UPI002468934F|nr:Arc family DNA-binding protein [Arsenophonus sp. aPb]WGL99173.1 Arc family DNA-binding protein [Arsenophonus sp. aPb]
MSTELKEMLQEEAKKNGRSLNSEIIKRLEDSLGYVGSQSLEERADFMDRLRALEELIDELKSDTHKKTTGE